MTNSTVPPFSHGLHIPETVHKVPANVAMKGPQGFRRMLGGKGKAARLALKLTASAGWHGDFATVRYSPMPLSHQFVATSRRERWHLILGSEENSRLIGTRKPNVRCQ